MEDLIERLKSISNIKITEKIVYVMLIQKKNKKYIKVGSTIDVRSRLIQIRKEYDLDCIPELLFIFNVERFLSFERKIQKALQKDSTNDFYTFGKNNGLSEFFNITEDVITFFERIINIEEYGFNLS